MRACDLQTLTGVSSYFQDNEIGQPYQLITKLSEEKNTQIFGQSFPKLSKYMVSMMK